jgi:hypothetical protein
MLETIIAEILGFDVEVRIYKKRTSTFDTYIDTMYLGYKKTFKGATTVLAAQLCLDWLRAKRRSMEQRIDRRGAYPRDTVDIADEEFMKDVSPEFE